MSKRVRSVKVVPATVGADEQQSYGQRNLDWFDRPGSEPGQSMVGGDPKMYRDILVHVKAYEHWSPHIDVALGIARDCGARLTAL